MMFGLCFNIVGLIVSIIIEEGLHECLKSEIIFTLTYFSMACYFKTLCLLSIRFTHHYLRHIPHTRLRARNQYTSSPLIGGKGGAGPRSLHTTLEGPTEYVDARWM